MKYDNLIYIAGKITGEPDYEDKFSKAEVYLRKLGYKRIVNPVSLAKALPDYPNLTWEMYMAVAIGALENCQAIALLPNWVKSRGAKQEHDIAREMEIEIIYLKKDDLKGTYSNEKV